MQKVSSLLALILTNLGTVVLSFYVGALRHGVFYMTQAPTFYWGSGSPLYI